MSLDKTKKLYDGLKDNVIRMIAGEKIKVNFSKFQNDMTTFNSADDVLTLLVHLWYLPYGYKDICEIKSNKIQNKFYELRLVSRRDTDDKKVCIGV